MNSRDTFLLIYGGGWLLFAWGAFWVSKLRIKLSDKCINKRLVGE